MYEFQSPEMYFNISGVTEFSPNTFKGTQLDEIEVSASTPHFKSPFASVYVGPTASATLSRL